ncbi:hypothetical protein VNO77_01978 [Canavalia gladiata]|uniref:Uncharacterized protein n=1 Tax=Canavalia gladiata TaxID=3824 RepID=A0AAN9R5P4_CANGL
MNVAHIARIKFRRYIDSLFSQYAKCFSMHELCQPTFAMTGALAWQVKKINKKIIIVWLWGRSHGNSRVLPLVWCVMCSFSFFLSLLPIYLSTSLLATDYTAPLDSPRLQSNKVSSISLHLL